MAARWAFSELYSERWSSFYLGILSEKHGNGLGISDFDPEKIAQLVKSFVNYRKYLVAELDIADHYDCQSWTKEQLCRTYTIMRMSPDHRTNIPFLSFLASPRSAGADDQLSSDPRAVADAIPVETPFIQTEPVIIVRQYGMDILLEGYLRSILFMRMPEPEARILVWYPVS